MQDTELLNKVEAALFLAARFLTIEELVRLTDINPITMRELLKKLEHKYNKQESALTILKRQVEKEEYWKMDVKNHYSHYINKIASGKAEFTKAEKGTLAVIAYKQPIKQSIIVKIRGNKAYDHVKHFVRNDLIRARRLGRTFELTLSERFYDYFNIKKEELKNETEKEVEEQIEERMEKVENANNS
jgi:segregation and condensation protein B